MPLTDQPAALATPVIRLAVVAAVKLLLRLLKVFMRRPDTPVPDAVLLQLCRLSACFGAGRTLVMEKAVFSTADLAVVLADIHGLLQVQGDARSGCLATPLVRLVVSPSILPCVKHGMEVAGSVHRDVAVYLVLKALIALGTECAEGRREQAPALRAAVLVFLQHVVLTAGFTAALKQCTKLLRGDKPWGDAQGAMRLVAKLAPAWPAVIKVIAGAFGTAEAWESGPARDLDSVPLPVGPPDAPGAAWGTGEALSDGCRGGQAALAQALDVTCCLLLHVARCNSRELYTSVGGKLEGAMVDATSWLAHCGPGGSYSETLHNMAVLTVSRVLDLVSCNMASAPANRDILMSLLHTASMVLCKVRRLDCGDMPRCVAEAIKVAADRVGMAAVAALTGHDKESAMARERMLLQGLLPCVSKAVAEAAVKYGECGARLLCSSDSFAWATVAVVGHSPFSREWSSYNFSRGAYVLMCLGSGMKAAFARLALGPDPVFPHAFPMLAYFARSPGLPWPAHSPLPNFNPPQGEVRNVFSRSRDILAALGPDLDPVAVILASGGPTTSLLQCPLCLEGAEDSRPCLRMPCSHSLHTECLQGLVAHGFVQCPLCKDPWMDRAIEQVVAHAASASCAALAACASIGCGDGHPQGHETASATST